jgi:hypothetical protein
LPFITHLSRWNKKKGHKVTNLGNMAHVAIQLPHFVPKSVGQIMQYAVEHYCIEETTSPMPTTQGNDNECSGIHIAAHFGRSLEFNFDSQEQIPCALYLYNRKKQSTFSSFLMAE